MSYYKDLAIERMNERMNTLHDRLAEIKEETAELKEKMAALGDEEEDIKIELHDIGVGGRTQADDDAEEGRWLDRQR